ncbi:Glutathione S-transferase P [Mactra antiquata]
MGGSKFTMSSYKFYYFQVRGRGECIRLLLADNNVDYEEIDVAPDLETWVKEWKGKMPFGQAPLLQDGDLELAQSMAILRHLGRKIGRSGASIEDRAKLDMITEHVEDIRNGYVKMIYTNYEDGKDDYIKELSGKLKPLDTLLQKWGSDFITQSIAFADYNLFDLLDIHLTLSPSCLDDFSTLRKFYEKVLNRPRIKEYRESDGFKSRPINYNRKQ